MSREVYQPPTLLPPQGQTVAPAAAANQTYGTDPSKPTTYICGDCNAKVKLKRSDVVRCGECGHRILYKERTPRLVQFQAI